jgi:uroporphyrinogen-III synthase
MDLTYPLDQPLAHRLILVTRAATQASEFTAALTQAGAQVLEMPTLEIGPPSSWEGLDHALLDLPTFDWLVLTSANGVDAFFERLNRFHSVNPLGAARSQAHLPYLKIAVVGQKTARQLAQYGMEPTLIPQDFVADALVEEFPDPLPGCRILFPRVESGGREVLVQAFHSQGAKVVEVAAYESRCPKTLDPAALAALQSRQVDVMTFASSKTVLHCVQLLRQAFGENGLNVLDGVALASIGPQTSKTCREQLGRVDIEAQVYTLEGLTAEIVAFFAGKPQG